MPPCHDIHVLSIKAEVNSEGTSMYYRVYRNNIPNELVQPLLTDSGSAPAIRAEFVSVDAYSGI